MPAAAARAISSRASSADFRWPTIARKPPECLCFQVRSTTRGRRPQPIRNARPVCGPGSVPRPGVSDMASHSKAWSGERAAADTAVGQNCSERTLITGEEGVKVICHNWFVNIVERNETASYFRHFLPEYRSSDVGFRARSGGPAIRYFLHVAFLVRSSAGGGNG